MAGKWLAIWAASVYMYMLVTCVEGQACNIVNTNSTCNSKQLEVCGDWSGPASCQVGWRNHTFCILPNNTQLTGNYSATRPHTSVAYPELTVPVSSNQEICYAIVQFRLQNTSVPRDQQELLVSLEINFDSADVFVNMSEKNSLAIQAFVQVCCHDIACFDLGSLLHPSDPNTVCRSAPFTLKTTVSVSAVECESPPLPQDGSHSCYGDTFPIGHYCTYSCSRGYSMVGQTTVRCVEGKWTHPPPECLPFAYTVSPLSLQIGETNASSVPSSHPINITIAVALSEALAVPVRIESLPSSVTVTSGVSFEADVNNQIQVVTLASSVDNQLLDMDVRGQLIIGSATMSPHYDGYPRHPTVVNISLVDSEPYVAEFLLSAFHMNGDMVFEDQARRPEEITASPFRTPINASSLVRVAPAVESGTLAPTVVCETGQGNTSSPLVYADRLQLQDLVRNDFSIDAWVKINSRSVSPVSSYLLKYTSSTPSSSISLQFTPSQSNEDRFDLHACVGVSCWLFNVTRQASDGENITVSIAANEWHHIAFVYTSATVYPPVVVFMDGKSTSIAKSSISNTSSNSSQSFGLEVCTDANLELDLLRVIPDNTRFSVNTQVPFRPPHQNYHFFCHPLQAPVNGLLSCTGYTAGSTCTASCCKGYSLQESFTARRTCSSIGAWSGSPSLCIPMSISASPDSLTLSSLPDITGFPSRIRISISLNTRIDFNVDVPLSTALRNAGTELLAVSPASLTFEPSTWQVAQTVTVSAMPVNHRRVYSPIETLPVTVGPATGSDHYRGFPVTSPTLSFIWVNSELYIAAFYLFSPWFSLAASFEAHSRVASGQNTTIIPTSVMSVQRVMSNSTPMSTPKLATETVISLSPPFFASYADRDIFHIGTREFHLDFWASVPATLALPIVHYSSSFMLTPGVTDSSGFSVSLEGSAAEELARTRMTVCIAAECSTCEHMGLDHEWKHYTVIRDTRGSTKCFINGQRVAWNNSVNVWLSNAMPGSPLYSLFVGGQSTTTTPSIAMAFIELFRLFVDPPITSLTTLPLLPGELSLLDCGLITSVGTTITCNGSQGLHSDSCHVRCRSGRIVGSPDVDRTLVCQPDSQWSNTPYPACQLDCSVLTVPNGFASCGNGRFRYLFSTPCNVTCNTGFSLVGSSGTITCASGGMWSDPDLMCISNTAPPVSSPPPSFPDGDHVE